VNIEEDLGILPTIARRRRTQGRKVAKAIVASRASQAVLVSSPAASAVAAVTSPMTLKELRKRGGEHSGGKS
jgi:hypothetical protein